MTLPPDSYVDSMPSDPALLVDLGRVTWAAARLHSGVRDAVNAHNGVPSDEPFTWTLGQAVGALERLARMNSRPDQLEWVTREGRPAVRRRNAVVHAVMFTASDGQQAIGTVDHSPPGRFVTEDLRTVTRHLIGASMSLPR